MTTTETLLALILAGVCVVFLMQLFAHGYHQQHETALNGLDIRKLRRRVIVKNAVLKSGIESLERRIGEMAETQQDILDEIAQVKSDLNVLILGVNAARQSVADLTQKVSDLQAELDGANAGVDLSAIASGLADIDNTIKLATPQSNATAPEQPPAN